MNSDRLTKILAVITGVFAICYLGVNIYNSVGSGYKTSTAYIQNVAQTVDADMYIIRNEKVLENSGGSVVVPLAVNGERVSNGSEIAAVFRDETSAENYSQALALKEKLEVYEKIDGQVRLANLDLEKLNSEIYDDFCAMLNSVYDNDFSSLTDLELSFSEKLSRKNISLGYDVDCSEQIAALKAEIAKVASSAPSDIVTAESSGYYVSRPDGYEGILTVDDIENLTEEKFTEALETEKKDVPENSLGKIIEGYKWYVAAIVDSDGFSNAEVGKKVSLILGDSDSETLPSKVCYKKVLEDNRMLLVFQCTNMSEQLATLRKVTGKIVLKNYNGIKIKKDAVRFDKDGNEGVYIREGNIAKFNKIEEIFSGDTFVVARDKTGSSGWLAQYDEIIISGKELSNGKVIE